MTNKRLSRMKLMCTKRVRPWLLNRFRHSGSEEKESWEENVEVLLEAAGWIGLGINPGSLEIKSLL